MKGKQKLTDIPDNIFDDPNKQILNKSGEIIPENEDMAKRSPLSNDDSPVMNADRNQISRSGNKNRDHVQGDNDSHHNRLNRPRSNPSDNQGR
ncbi:MAG: hypothetical protein M3142_02775 [Bacteroidota bacterium]|nr:hypothetical protein [Bacteroidota bacterium]